MYDDFYKDYKERYNQMWIRRFGIIPHLPTSLDNSNSIYELLAWLQRAFKGLLDDFINQQLEFEQFKNALTLLLEKMIPELIRQYVKSDEFKKIIFDLIDKWYEKNLKPIIEKMQADIDKNKEDIENLKAEINNLKQQIQNLQDQIDELKNLIQGASEENKQEIARLRDLLDKILSHLADIGVWDMDSNDFVPNMGIAGGNINLFGGSQDGNYYIRTNNSQTENDLVGGI